MALFQFLGARAGCAGLGCRLGFFAEKGKKEPGPLHPWRKFLRI